MKLQSSHLRIVYNFVAKHPVTKPNIERIEKSELNLAEKIDELMQTAIDTAEIIEVKQGE